MEVTPTIQPLSNDQRTQWNGLLDNLNGQPVTEDALNAHAQANPGFSITPEMLPQIQQEHAAIRTGDSFGNLNADQLNTARTGMSPNFIGQTDLSKSKYPEFKIGSQDFGTDIEGYSNFKAGLAPVGAEGSIDTAKAAGPAPASVVSPLNAVSLTSPESGVKLIPRPDYTNQASRNRFIQNWSAQYGNLEGRGDDILRVNDIPRAGSTSIKNIATKAASKAGIDPALLYSSFMEEGGSALFKNLNGTDTKGRNPDDPNYMEKGYNKDFSVKFDTLGLNTFVERFPDLVKGGYLPKDFQKNFTWEGLNSTDSAVQAKAAMMKYSNDEANSYAKQKGIDLSPKAKEFFGMVAYNSGEGGLHKLLKEYNEKGLLKDDQFLKENPHKGEKIPENQDIYSHVIRRFKMRDALKEQKQF